MTVAGACLLAACSGQTVTGPDPVTQAPEAAAPVAQATPAPQPVAEPTTTPQHDARVKGGFYSVTNTTGIPQFYCAAAFGVLPGGDQGAHTNIYEDQGVRQPKDVFSGQAPKTAACQYKQIQVDLTQSKDCRKFDWHNVLAAEVYANPGYIEAAKKVLVAESEAGPWSEYGAYSEYGPWSAWSNDGCGTRIRTRTRTRTRDFFKVEKFECSGEIVKTKIRTETETQTDTQTETKECCEAPEFWNQSFNANKNEIKFNAHARGQGTWTLTLYATSSYSEYLNNDPDYTKDVDTDIVTKCQNGQTELKVDYDWRYHSSRYWWAVIRFNDVVKWKSAAVDHTLYD